MANPAHLKFIKRGVAEWNHWRDQYPEAQPDLRSADLTNVDLSDANLVGVNFNGADLSNATMNGANLQQASFCGAILCGADLRQAYVGRANFTSADLSNTKLNNAAISGATFNMSILNNTDFSLAYINEAVFAHNDLSNVKGLDTIIHRGPSAISIGTLIKSRGNIPLEFLLGCGVPDDIIVSLQPLLGSKVAAHYYSCFISYSHKDEDFVKCLYSRLREEHIRVWFAPEDIKGGEKLHEQIYRAIQEHDRVLIVLSENSLHSEWVMTEIRNARRGEIKENRRKLFPLRLVNYEQLQDWVCFDPDSGKDLALEVREYFIPDFSNWREKEFFETTFNRLLRDLESEMTRQKGT